MKTRILIVDDHPLVRDGLKVMLSLAPDFDVIGEACDAFEALEWLGEHSTDIVLIDISMPGMNGIEAIRRIRAMRSFPKVIVFSMHDSEEYIAQVEESGASGYVLKCANMESLFSTIRETFAGATAFAVVKD